MPCITRFAIVLLMTSIALPALAQDNDDDTSLDDVPHVTMVGTAQTEVVPDLATITLGVTTEKPTAKAAADDNARKARAVVDAAKARGIAATDIATQSMTLTQTFDQVLDGHGQATSQRPRGFEAENIVAIKVRDLSKVGTLAESLVQSGANRFDGVGFAVEHPEPLQVKLMGEAVKNAKAQAQVAAEASGSRLGRVLLIERPGEGATVYRPMAAAKRRMAAPAPPVEAGTQTLNSTVAVTWALEPN